jgi:prevent-host-death family protein
MREATLSEASRELAHLIECVRAGESVLITADGKPAAYLVPAHTARIEGDEARLALLEANGIIVRGKGPPVDLEPFPEDEEPAGAVQALLDEREEGL